MIQKYQRLTNSITKIIIVTVVIVLILTIWYWWGINSSSLNNEQTELFPVGQGESVDQIGQRLSDEGYIESEFLFKLYLQLHSLSRDIQAGDHYLSPALSIKEIVDNLINVGEIQEQSITIIEGLTNEAIAKVLAEQQLMPSTDFLAAASRSYDYDWLPPITKPNYLQGFLFPDTYRLYLDASAEDLITRMLDNFERKVDKDLRQTIAKQGKSLFEVITLASIVENEVSTTTDRKLVADIFWRRLRDSYPLQSDATVNYVTKKGLIQPSIVDTKIDSPYNTYKYSGLPLGPISNPGLDAIEAVVYPLPNSYYFFLTTKDDGRVIYSRTYEEHLQNKAKYLD